jgi:hypothetical protein
VITTPISAGLVRGAVELEPTDHGLLPHRLPAWARRQTADEQLLEAETRTSGVRVVFRTNATTIELDTLRTTVRYAVGTARPDGIYDLVVDGELAAQSTGSGGNVQVINVDWTSRFEPGPVGTVRFTGLAERGKDVEIWLPHNEPTELVALRTDAPVEETSTKRRVWLHHGSSISHGSNATNPTAIWPAVAAARAGVELVNLAFSGSALLDPFTARTMRDVPADLISVKIGINLVNKDLMRLRAFGPAVHGFLDTIRDGHPTTPLLVISSILCPIHEDTPGPCAMTIDPETMRASFHATGTPEPDRLTLRIIREELKRIVQQKDDPHIHYLDGRELYGEGDVERFPLPDALHPDTETHGLIGERFADLVFKGPWA